MQMSCRVFDSKCRPVYDAVTHAGAETVSDVGCKQVLGSRSRCTRVQAAYTLVQGSLSALKQHTHQCSCLGKVQCGSLSVVWRSRAVWLLKCMHQFHVKYGAHGHYLPLLLLHRLLLNHADTINVSGSGYCVVFLQSC